MRSFELLELLEQLVILAIGNLRSGVNIIELVVTPDLVSQFFKLASNDQVSLL
jgi:hypothetical protein